MCAEKVVKIFHSNMRSLIDVDSTSRSKFAVKHSLCAATPTHSRHLPREAFCRPIFDSIIGRHVRKKNHDD